MIKHIGQIFTRPKDLAKTWFYLPVFFLAIKILLTLNLELSNDEVYYFTYAKLPQLSYFDHAPILGWVLYLFTLGGNIASDLLMRLPAILVALFNSYFLLSWLGKKYGNQAGVFAMVLYNTSLYTGFIAGFLILPDSVQLLFYMLALYFAEAISINEKKLYNWLGFGLFTGLAILSKYHGIMLWAGMGLYILVKKRALLLKPQVYVSAAISLVLLVPIVLWNYNNDFISFTFHESRVGGNNEINWVSFSQYLIGQVAYMNPVIFIGIAALFLFKSPKKYSGSIHFYLALPLLIVPVIMSLGKSTLPHWSGPAYISLFIYVAINFVHYTKWVQAITKTSLILILIVCSLAIPVINTPLISSVPKKDFTLDLYGYNELAMKLDQYLLDNDLKKEEVLLQNNKWFPGGHLYFYLGEQANFNVKIDGSLKNIHHFDWINKSEIGFKDSSFSTMIYLSSNRYKSKFDNKDSTWVLNESKFIDINKGNEAVISWKLDFYKQKKPL